MFQQERRSSSNWGLTQQHPGEVPHTPSHGALGFRALGSVICCRVASRGHGSSVTSPPGNEYPKSGPLTAGTPAGATVRTQFRPYFVPHSDILEWC